LAASQRASAATGTGALSERPHSSALLWLYSS
jgi:hypothetical protein